MNINTARTEANIATRALTLWADGYTCEQSPFGDTFAIGRPEGGFYVVTLPTAGRDAHCTCPCFPKARTCKHYIATQAEYDKWQEFAAEYDRAAW